MCEHPACNTADGNPCDLPYCGLKKYYCQVCEIVEVDTFGDVCKDCGSSYSCQRCGDETSFVTQQYVNLRAIQLQKLTYHLDTYCHVCRVKKNNMVSSIECWDCHSKLLIKSLPKLCRRCASGRTRVCTVCKVNPPSLNGILCSSCMPKCYSCGDTYYPSRNSKSEIYCDTCISKHSHNFNTCMGCNEPFSEINPFYKHSMCKTCATALFTEADDYLCIECHKVTTEEINSACEYCASTLHSCMACSRTRIRQAHEYICKECAKDKNYFN